MALHNSRRRCLTEVCRDYSTRELDFTAREGLLPAIILLLLPFGILWVLIKLLPPWTHEGTTA